MPVDNAMYDRLAHTWWDEDEWLHLLRTPMKRTRDRSVSYVGHAVARI